MSAFPGKPRPPGMGVSRVPGSPPSHAVGPIWDDVVLAIRKGVSGLFGRFQFRGAWWGSQRRPRFTTRFPSRNIGGSTPVLSEELTRLSRSPRRRVCGLIRSALFRSVGVLRHPLRRKRLAHERLEKISQTARKLARENFSPVDACCGTNCTPRGNKKEI